MAAAPDARNGALTWHYVLHVILLLAPLLFAEANGRREEQYGASEGDTDRQPGEDVRPVVPYRRVVFQHLFVIPDLGEARKCADVDDFRWLLETP